MMYPSIDSLVKKYDSKYTIAVAAAKRARQILEMSKEKGDTHNTSSGQEYAKPVSQALFELDSNSISIEKPNCCNE